MALTLHALLLRNKFVLWSRFCLLYCSLLWLAWLGISLQFQLQVFQWNGPSRNRDTYVVIYDHLSRLRPYRKRFCQKYGFAKVCLMWISQSLYAESMGCQKNIKTTIFLATVYINHITVFIWYIVYKLLYLYIYTPSCIWILYGWSLNVKAYRAFGLRMAVAEGTVLVMFFISHWPDSSCASY